MCVCQLFVCFLPLCSCTAHTETQSVLMTRQTIRNRAIINRGHRLRQSMIDVYRTGWSDRWEQCITSSKRCHQCSLVDGSKNRSDQTTNKTKWHNLTAKWTAVSIATWLWTRSDQRGGGMEVGRERQARRASLTKRASANLWRVSLLFSPVVTCANWH